MWNYSKKMMDHFLEPRNSGEMENPDGVGSVGNLVCGDSMKLMIKVDEKSNRITAAKFLTFGCGSAIASSSALTEMVIGKTLDEAMAISDSDIADFLDGLPPEKLHCSVMGADALHAAIADFRGEPIPDAHAHEEDIVCHCFGVTRQKIEEVVLAHDLTTTEQVTQYTKAGGGCGKCLTRIGEVIAETRAKEKAKNEPAPLTNFERMKRIEEALETVIRPALAADGGNIELIDVQNRLEGAKVVVKLLGRCATCAASGATLRGFVESKLRELVEPNLEIAEENS